ncbi:hypothetical protein DFH27DRAFT_270546 [Peziza echinospora]|nr:hypothetical protein DFH27DRAFT_270546 [Peziza echinospora]
MSGNPRHLYRSILREISYHHDDLARALLPKYIRDSFDRSAEILASLQGENDQILHRDRLLSYHKLGRRTHSLLIRANAGEQKAAIRVLKYTYGRIGRKSRELMEPLLSKEHHPPLVPDVPHTSPPKILPQLAALAAAQTSIVKRIAPVIPELNHFKKPFNKNREANMKKRAFNEGVPKLMPPIPPEELARLEQLVTGELDQPLIARRARPKEKILVVAGVVLGEGETDEGEIRRRRVLENFTIGHHLTKSFRKRLYKQILGMSPTLVQVDSEPVFEKNKRPDQPPQNRGPRWKVVYSPLRKAKPPVEGLEEEFPEQVVGPPPGQRAQNKPKDVGESNEQPRD